MAALREKAAHGPGRPWQWHQGQTLVAGRATCAKMVEVWLVASGQLGWSPEVVAGGGQSCRQGANATAVGRRFVRFVWVLWVDSRTQEGRVMQLTCYGSDIDWRRDGVSRQLS
jgi:hypothetical protein